MSFEERVSTALRAKTESLPPARTDLSVIRSAARAQSLRRGTIGLACAAVAVGVALVAGVTDVGRDRSGELTPVAPSSPSPSPTASTPTEASEATEATKATDLTGTGSWTTYTSSKYGLQVGHPADWTAVPAVRRWDFETDVADYLSASQEVFMPPSPAPDVRVSVWSAPLDPGTRIESTADIEAWVADYCRAEGNTPCTGIHERAVELCLEKWDCHPGLLVPFKDDVQAFFSGGIYDAEAMTVVAVWRPESDPSVAPYGGSRRLLEGFLSTMQVWPASTPVDERR